MSEEKHKGERIAKRIARAGICSRRDAEKLVNEGRVKVNGKVIDSPALNVVGEDHIVVNGKPLPEKQQARMFMYHKPPGLVTTHKDEQGRSTVFENLPDSMPRVVSVGRLDLNTEGLLLLTNDGELSRYLELPETGWARRYRVRVNGKVDERRLKSLKNGITVEGIRYKSIEAVLEQPPEGENKIGANSWLMITLREGKNREVRRVMEAIGLRVTRLIRTDYGPFSLGKMTRGSAVEIKTSVLKDQIPKFFGDATRHAEQVEERQKRQGRRPDSKRRTFDKNHKNRKNEGKSSR
ncbi:MAG: pseudouridine synthase [Alphaproteobacteria bacterium]